MATFIKVHADDNNANFINVDAIQGFCSAEHYNCRTTIWLNGGPDDCIHVREEIEDIWRQIKTGVIGGDKE